LYLFGIGRKILPAQPPVDREVGEQPVVVGGEGAERGLAQIAGVVIVQVRDQGTLIGQTQQIIGEIVAGLDTCEVEGAARVRIAGDIVLPPLETKPVGDGLFAVNLDQLLVDGRGLNARR
jgi:hypothetical protein